MGKIIETKIDTFNHGILADVRSKDAAGAQMVRHFDNFTTPHKLTPYRNSENGDSSAATSQKQRFAVALRTGSTYNLFALGVKNGVSNAEVMYKNLDNSGNGLNDATWTHGTNYQSGSTFTWFNLFVYYKKASSTGLIYGALGSSAAAGTNIWAFDPTDATAFNDTAQALTFTHITQGIVASDDILYIPYANVTATTGGFVMSKNGTSAFNTTALTLPLDMIPTCICEHGNYLAIGCRSTSGGVSRVYLWDKTSTSWNDVADFPADIYAIASLDGNLIGVSVVNIFLTANLTQKIVFSQYATGTAKVIRELKLSGNNASITTYQRVGSRLYFDLTAADPEDSTSTAFYGIWSIGRNVTTEPFELIHHYLPNNDTAVSSIQGFIIVGDYVFISYKTGGTTFGLSKTSYTSSYTATSIYETLKFDGGDISLTKKLLGVTVMTPFLPSGGQVVLKYRIDQTLTWTTIFTNTTANSLSHDAVNIESTGATLPEYKEIQFRIESTGGAEITGLKFKSELIDKVLY